MPLVEIAALLRHPDEGETQMVLEQHRARMQERLRKTELILARLNHALAGKRGLMPYEIRLVEVEPQWVLSRRAHTLLADLDPSTSSRSTMRSRPAPGMVKPSLRSRRCATRTWVT